MGPELFHAIVPVPVLGAMDERWYRRLRTRRCHTKLHEKDRSSPKGLFGLCAHWMRTVWAIRAIWRREIGQPWPAVMMMINGKESCTPPNLEDNLDLLSASGQAA